MSAATIALRAVAQTAADVTIDIAPYTLEPGGKRRIQTVAYNGQVPGPLLRLRQGREVSVAITNRTGDPEIVHWHGLTLPSDIDGAMEEGTPAIAPGATSRYRMTPDPAGFRWFHTHTFAGKNLRKAQYGGQHGFLLIEPADNPGQYDQEIFLALHDWEGQDLPSEDGSMNPSYEVSTINGKMLGAGDPIKVRQGQRLLLHLLNSSPTDVHWIAFAGHRFQVIALDGNAVPKPLAVDQLRLAPAERISALVEMNSPGSWILGDVRKHVQAAGMGIVFEYEGVASSKPRWNQPDELLWNYHQFAVTSTQDTVATPIPLTFTSKFRGHGSEEQWLINGKSYPQTEEPVLEHGKRYRLILKNDSMDDHPLHLHRHRFEVRSVAPAAGKQAVSNLSGILKDVLLVPTRTTAEVEFIADNPGLTLFHCHQQNHMDRGFMMVFRYA
jgi:FtsP/CotA-like multicopper oxidase with cupredoxin domain